MKLTVMTQITVDGVVQGNGGASDEDRRKGFERGGWARGAGDDETRTLITRTYQRADAFLFGAERSVMIAGHGRRAISAQWHCSRRYGGVSRARTGRSARGAVRGLALTLR